MPFRYKTVLVIGATSGIGLALAEKIIANGSHVIAIGRRKEDLDSLVEKHGKDKVTPYQFDITNLSSIPSFVGKVTNAHPNLECALFNSGIQRGIDFTKPETVDLDAVSAEFTTNYLSYVHLTTALLPSLQKQSSPTEIIFVTSGLALTPITRCPNYCASKAAAHHLILTLREQLKGSNVKIVELLPPAVQTELHDEKHQPDIKNGRSIGMPLDEFTDKAWKGLQEGGTDIPIGMAEEPYKSWEKQRQEGFKAMVEQMRGS